MKRLAFSFYKNLMAQLEDYDTHFAQLLRDYERERNGAQPIFSLDFSEIYPYLHPEKKNIYRAEINRYVLNNLDERFSVLPATAGEFANDLQKVLPHDVEKKARQAISSRPVRNFIEKYPFVKNSQELIQIYGPAETELQSQIGQLLDLVVETSAISTVKGLRDLFGTKIVPIRGVVNLGKLDDESRELANLVNTHLNLSRPEFGKSNLNDSIDVVIALALNKSPDVMRDRFITIYTQTGTLIAACRAHKKLMWADDYLVRELTYFKYRTKLQKEYKTLDTRIAAVKKCLSTCRSLIESISGIIDVDEKLKLGADEEVLKNLDVYREFDENCMSPLTFTEDDLESAQDGRRSVEKIENIYRTLVAEDKFIGGTMDAFSVLKRHLSEIQNELQAFTPIEMDGNRINQYRSSLLGWLGLKLE